MEETKVSVSRRGFLVNLGKMAAGAAASATALSFAVSKGEASTAAAPSEAHDCSILGAPIRKLDLDALDKQGYESFKRGLY
jgi:hypothetical protein